MKKIISLFLFALMISAFSNLSFAKDKSDALLYKITGKGLQKPSYLYGTIHIICPTDMFGVEKLNGYLEQTDRLLMELDMDDAAEMQSMAGKLVMPDGKTLKDFLTAEEYAKVDELFKNYMGVSVENVNTVRPMFLAIMVSTSPKSMGCDKPNSYENVLLEIAINKRKPVEGLETVALQFEVMEKKSFAEQADELYKMAVTPQKFVDDFKRFIATYKSQNIEGLYKEMDGELGNKDFQEAMLDRRNINWIPKIEKAIGEKPTFIAVGGGHLGGKNGVVNLLRKKGYKVEAIKL